MVDSTSFAPVTKKSLFLALFRFTVDNNNSRSKSLEEDVDANFESDILKEQNAHEDSLEVCACAKEGVVSGLVSFCFVLFRFVSFRFPFRLL